MEPPFDGGPRQGKEFGDSADLPLFAVKELNDDLNAFRQIGDEAANSGISFPPEQLFLRMPYPAVVVGSQQQVYLVVRDRGTAALTAQEAPCPVASYSVDPGSEARGVFKLLELLKCLQKRILRRVLRRISRSQSLPGNEYDSAPVPADELIVGLAAPGQRCRYQVPVLDNLIARSCRHAFRSSC